MNDMLIEVREDGYIMILAPIRWLLVDGEVKPVEGIDANGVIHTIVQSNVAWMVRGA